MMKTFRLSLALVLTTAGLVRADDQPIPKAFPAERYAQLVARSPFAPASLAAPATEEPDFAQNLYITAIAKVGAQDCVFISSRDQVTKFALFGHEPSKDGVTLESIEWSPSVGKSRVMLKKGGQVGTVSFDEALIHVAASPQVNSPDNGQPRAPGAPRFDRGGGNGQGPTGTFQRRRTRIIGGGPQ